jgi:D-alanyl-lipoteichoic acid acyltransferase DltB (MBOAT superfamily)
LLFNSYPFLLIFLPVTLVGFFRIARGGHRLAAMWLAFSSLVFYAWWNPIYVTLLAASIAFNYMMGVQITAGTALGQLRSSS